MAWLSTCLPHGWQATMLRNNPHPAPAEAAAAAEFAGLADIGNTRPSSPGGMKRHHA